MDAYQELANAIILSAVEDYRLTIKGKKLRKIEKFFLSDWFAILTNLDGKELLRELRKEKKENECQRVL